MAPIDPRDEADELCQAMMDVAWDMSEDDREFVFLMGESTGCTTAELKRLRGLAKEWLP